MKNIRSRKKYLGVTFIIFIGGPLGSGFKFDAYVDIDATTVDIKSVPPMIKLIEVEASYIYAESSEAANEANKSGAPFPKARRVTPAKDSGIENLTTMN